MQDRLKYVHGEWSRNFVYRFAALAYMMMPLDDMDSLRLMILQDIFPPFGALAWRLRSDHEVAAFLLGVAGVRTGANFYNGAHFDWAQDATRDVYQTRAVITTDAHVIRPENLRNINAVMPRQYRGGHDSRFVTDPKDLKSTSIARQKSVIATVASLRSIRDIASPLSFINKPPAQIERAGNDIGEVDLNRQFFDGADYYAKEIYSNLYGSAEQQDLARSLTSAQAVYKSDPTENHVAFEGFNIRYDYKERHYCRDVSGTGHRGDKRLNSPGARAYLNGETSVLPLEHSSIEWLLN